MIEIGWYNRIKMIDIKNPIFIGLISLSKYGEELPKSTEENRWKKMSKNVNELETMLKEQVEAGLITDFELRRIMARATGGVYLDDGQAALFELAKT